MNGQATCWGDNSLGQCDVPKGYKFTSIAAGHSHTPGAVDHAGAST